MDANQDGYISEKDFINGLGTLSLINIMMN